jgi:hypothetical protein
MARGWWRSPAARAVFFVAFGLVAFAAILLFGQHNSTDRRFTHGLAFRAWAAAATVSLGASIAVFGRGLSAIREHRRMATWDRPRRWWMWNVAAYAAVAVVAVALLRLATVGNPVHTPVRGFPTLIGSLTLVGVIAACPWLLMVWLAHEQVRHLGFMVGTIKPAQVTDDFDLTKLDGPAITDAVTCATAIWTAIERCALALRSSCRPRSSTRAHCASD